MVDWKTLLTYVRKHRRFLKSDFKLDVDYMKNYLCSLHTYSAYSQQPSNHHDMENIHCQGRAGQYCGFIYRHKTIY